MPRSDYVGFPRRRLTLCYIGINKYRSQSRYATTVSSLSRRFLIREKRGGRGRQDSQTFYMRQNPNVHGVPLLRVFPSIFYLPNSLEPSSIFCNLCREAAPDSETHALARTLEFHFRAGTGVANRGAFSDS